MACDDRRAWTDSRKSSRAGWAWPSPVGGSRRRFPASATSALSPGPRSTRCSPAGSKTVTRAATAAAPSTRFRSPAWPSACGRATTFPAARPRTRPTYGSRSTAWHALARSPKTACSGTSWRSSSPAKATPTRSASTTSRRSRRPHLVSIYGAMLAGVGYILMGAGIPLKIPGVLDAYVNHEPATYPLYVVRGGGRRRHDDALQAARFHGMRSAAPRAAPVPADHRVERPGGHAAEEGQRRGGRVHHRGPDSRRAQRAAARTGRRSTIRASRSTVSATG